MPHPAWIPFGKFMIQTQMHEINSYLLVLTSSRCLRRARYPLALACSSTVLARFLENCALFTQPRTVFCIVMAAFVLSSFQVLGQDAYHLNLSRHPTVQLQRRFFRISSYFIPAHVSYPPSGEEPTDPPLQGIGGVLLPQETLSAVVFISQKFYLLIK